MLLKSEILHMLEASFQIGLGIQEGLNLQPFKMPFVFGLQDNRLK